MSFEFVVEIVVPITVKGGDHSLLGFVCRCGKKSYTQFRKKKVTLFSKDSYCVSLDEQHFLDFSKNHEVSEYRVNKV